MAVPRLDPRVNTDRIYQYGDYQVLSAQFRRQKRFGWLQYIPIIGDLILSPPKVAVRLLPYKLGLLLGVMALITGLGALAFFSADTARLEYQKQEYATSLAGIEQSLTDAMNENTQKQSEVFAGNGLAPHDVDYPVLTNYLVLTNVPEADGRTLVEELYPLSSKLIRIEP
jgi:hypothetical protein